MEPLITSRVLREWPYWRGWPAFNSRAIVMRARAPRQVPKLALGGQRVPPPVTPLPLSAVASSSLFNCEEGCVEG
jgi:hypothetical protein